MLCLSNRHLHIYMAFMLFLRVDDIMLCNCQSTINNLYVSINYNAQVTEYYLDILETGRIHYVPNDWWIWVASSDTFTISILLETSNASVFINTLYNHSMEVVWSLVHPTHMFYLVRESSSVLELIFRYVSTYVCTI